MFMHTNHEEMQIYPQTNTVVGSFAWMSCFQPDAWCHQMKLKRQGYGQVTVILAVNIIPISVGYMRNKICLVREVFSSKVEFHKKS